MAKLIVSQNGEVIKNRFLNTSSFTIGSLDDNDLSLAGEGISRTHASPQSAMTTSSKTRAAPMARW